MIPQSKLYEIIDFALHNKFTVELNPDEDSDSVDMKISFGDRELQYRASDDAIFIEDICYNGSLADFEAEINLLHVMNKIGKMIKEAVGKGSEC